MGLENYEIIIPQERDKGLQKFARRDNKQVPENTTLIIESLINFLSQYDNGNISGADVFILPPLL